MNPALLQNASLVSLGMMFLGNDNKYTILLIVIVFIYTKKYEILNLYRDFKNLGSKTLEIEGSIMSELSDRKAPYPIFTKSINGILFYLKKNFKESSDSLINTMSSGYILNSLDRKHTSDLTSFLPINNPDGVWITPDIRLYVQLEKPSFSKEKQERDIDKEVLKEQTFKLKLSTKTLSMVQLYQFVEKCTNEYKTHMENEMLKSRIFEPSFSLTSDNIDHSSFQIPLETTKSFDNLFFEGKEALIQRLNSFKDKETYRRLGIPDSLGLLFYGNPGTGKTSTIKAIAKYMNMSIILVPMNQINSKKRLRKFFQTSHYGSDLEIPYDKRIYVFEEIDASNWGKIIRSRSLKKELTDSESGISSSSSTSQTIIINSSKDEMSKMSKKDEEPLTLGAILETLDGIIETPGRIIIMTTNHRELIDPALLRPGRIDFELEFKKLRRCDIASIFEMMYELTMPKETLRRIKDYTYSQAEISRLLFKHNTDPVGFLREF
jgi:DNA polymerase III delta prime subunit